MSTKLEQCFKRVYNTGDMRKIAKFLPNPRLMNPVGFDITVLIQQPAPFSRELAEVLYYGGVI